MRYMTCCDIKRIPQELMQPTLELNKFIVKELDIYLSVSDTYRLWTYVSMSLGYWWLPTTFTPPSISRVEFLEDMIDEFCEDEWLN